MKTCHSCQQQSVTPDHTKNETTCNRRDFAQKALTAGFLSALSIITLPRAADAWMDGKFNEREDLGDAFKALVTTYSDTRGYPHKFNDALVKLLLRDLDFAVRSGVHEEFAQHYVLTLGALINKYIKSGVEKFGKDIFLWGIFERTTCSYQLYEHIDIKDGVRTIPCPFKSILEQIQKIMGTYTITWDDVHNKWCIPVWKGFAEIAGVKIKVEPGETCVVKVL
ncbi:hypothetical protein ACFL43_00995 [Thermodesulfobacteriota bacterium]